MDWYKQSAGLFFYFNFNRLHLGGHTMSQDNYISLSSVIKHEHCYEKMEDIMEKIDHARKGRLMNIKENFHIYTYIYKQ
jgi:hypothetical protein